MTIWHRAAVLHQEPNARMACSFKAAKKNCKATPVSAKNEIYD
jgi:hypothetical protein